ncbi:Acylaminoacyl-peptidase [Bertholletia excelsa]
MLSSLTSFGCVNSLRPRFLSLSFLTSHLNRLRRHTANALSLSAFSKQRSISLVMDGYGASPLKEMPLGLDEVTEEEYASQSKLLQEFTSIPAINKAWTFKSNSEKGSVAMFSISQPNLLANSMRKYILSSNVLKESNGSIRFQWAPFPIEMKGVSVMVPSPSGSKLLVVHNSENDSPTQFEIWNPFQLEKEFHIPRSTHGSVYSDGWFEGISWNSDETLIAYVAEEPSPLKPTFSAFGYKKGSSTDKDCGSWKGQGDWEEDWGESYAGKRRPILFVIDVNSGEVRGAKGIAKSLSVGQVVWAPTKGLHRYLVFVGWSDNGRKLGIKYCYNRPCALYAVEDPFHESDPQGKATEDARVFKLTQSISSAFFPRFSPDGKLLVFLSAKSSVDSGAHSATDSLHRIDWPTDGKLDPSAKIVDVVPVVMCPEDDCFPGLYCSGFLSNPWLSDGYTMILSSVWGSTQKILSVNVLNGNVVRISPSDNFSWNVLALDGDNIIAVCSSPIDVPQIKYGYPIEESSTVPGWNWADVSSPTSICSEKVRSLLSCLEFNVMKIPVKGGAENLPKGATEPFEAIFVSSKTMKSGACNPLIVVLHGGPHAVSVSSFSKNLAFISALDYSLLIVNYRGSLGFGEEALQSLPGKVGSQDVHDVLTAIDHTIDMGLADASKIGVIGGSHGGFLTTHLIGQAPANLLRQWQETLFVTLL